MADQLDIVSGTSGTAQQLLEFELCSSTAGERDVDRATPDLLGRWVWWVVDRVAQEFKPTLSVLVSFGSQRVVVDSRRRPGDFTVVRGRVEIDHFQGCLQKIDAGNKGLSLDAVLVQFIGVSVGRCHQDDAVRHERLEKPARKSIPELYIKKGRIANLLRIMASATSVHWNSSKHKTLDASAMSAATIGSTSKSLPCFIFF